MLFGSIGSVVSVSVAGPHSLCLVALVSASLLVAEHSLVGFGIGVNRPAFGGTVPHFHQMSRGPAKSADVPHFSKTVLIFFFVADYSTCLPRNATK